MIDAQLGVQSIIASPQAMTNSATVTANFDCKGAGYATISIPFAIEKNTNGVGPTLSLLESDDTVATNFATITADRATETLVAAKLVRYDVDLRGRKRYLRLSVSTDTTTNDDITFAAIGTLTRKGETPLAAARADVVVTV